MNTVFSAVSSSAKQIGLLLRCVSFGEKAQILITKDGIRVTVDDTRVMQGVVFLDKALFTTYSFNYHHRDIPVGERDEDDGEVGPFEISLSALLQILQILGITENTSKDRWMSRDGMQRGGFESRDVLGVVGLCRITYPSIGAPLCITLEEGGVTTTGQLTTYEPSFFDEIPLQKDGIVQKVIMRANWLNDAVLELASTSPSRLTMSFAPQATFFTLSATGPFGSANVQFRNEPQLLETFEVSQRTVNVYKYSSIRSACHAMAAATKVSIRTDIQGVLSLQCMIQVEQESHNEKGFAFADFRFIPYVDAEDDTDDETGGNKVDSD